VGRARPDRLPHDRTGRARSTSSTRPRAGRAKDRLGEIDVPTLVVSGRHDEATPALQETLRAGIPGCEWLVFEESSHMPHVEERERYMDVVGAWLARHDRA
jgi:pimeloyl-ACP methyl ester carboxylesterase